MFDLNKPTFFCPKLEVNTVVKVTGEEKGGYQLRGTNVKDIKTVAKIRYISEIEEETSLTKYQIVYGEETDGQVAFHRKDDGEHYSGKSGSKGWKPKTDL